MITKNKKKFFSFFLVIFLGGGLFFLVAPVHASVGDWAGEVIGGLIGWIIGALGIILVLVMQALIAVAQYSNFIHSPAVSNGWAIVRDVCNMFFVLILLVIAFATILKIENYSYKKWLPKLILMAILINFSKTICGLLIDFAQVIMLTFVNAFKDIAAGNLITNLGITEILTLANNSDSVGFWAIVGAYVLGLIYIIIALVVIVTMLAMLVMRIVMIWIYIVLSPAAYLMSAFPGGQKYASQWWTEFSKNLIVGPVLAFFIWLSFVSLQTPTSTDFPVGSADAQTVAGQAGISGQGAAPTSASSASSPDVFIKFVIAIGMLIGGLKISQEIGGAAGSIAGKGMSKITKGAAFAGAGALALAKRGGKSAGMAVVNTKKVRGMLDTVGSQKGGLGQVLRFTGMRSLARQGSLSLGRHKLEVEEKAKKKIEAFKKVGATETLASIASGKAAGISQKAAKKEARKSVIVPEEHFDKTEGAVGLANPTDKREAEKRLNELDIDKDTPSLNQVMQLGKSGIDLGQVPQFRAYLEKNAKACGAYNSGQRDAGLHNYVAMRNRNGQELTGRGRYGVLTVGQTARDRGTGRTGDTTYALRTTEDEDEEQAEEEMAAEDTSPEIVKQRERIRQVTGSKDQGLIERTRNKINDWSTLDNKDHFQDDGQLKQAFAQAEAEQPKQVAVERPKQKIVPDSPEIIQQKQRIAKVTGSNDQGLIERTRNKINDLNVAEGKDNFQDDYQLRQAFNESKVDQKNEKKAKKETPGSGSLSVNGFARGQQSYVGVDFSKLDQGILEKMKGGKELSTQDIKGSITSDKGEIKKIAASVIGVIDSEINAIKSKGSAITKSDKHRLGNLEEAKAKFKDYKNIDKLELINSGAKGYTSSNDVKETIIHEDIHGLGVKSEGETDYLAGKAMAAPREREEIRSGGGKFMEHLENKMDIDRGKIQPPRRRPVKEIVSSEEDDDELEEYSMRTSSGGSEASEEKDVVSEENVTNTTNITNITNKENDKIKQDFKNNSAKSPNDSFMAYYFKNFITSLNKLGANLKNSKAAATPPSASGPAGSVKSAAPMSSPEPEAEKINDNSDINSNV